jgi:hypothetical protein
MGVIIPQNTDIIQLNQWLGDFSGTIKGVRLPLLRSVVLVTEMRDVTRRKFMTMRPHQLSY